MLSYRHGYHAGNFADVLKHFVLVEILNYLGKKEKPFDYIDTHAGAGLYSLVSKHATKNAEFENGIAKLYQPGSPFQDSMGDYLNTVHSVNQDENLRFYPGSPSIAAELMRPQDNAWCFELHPSDFELLRQSFTGKQFKLRHEDGFKGLNAVLPTRSRRALVLIDPPYEQKADYRRVAEAIKQGHQKMNNAIFALWYPVVERPLIRDLHRSLKHSGIRNIDVYELGIQKEQPGFGMTTSGMIVVNPPWTLKSTLETLLPSLAKKLSVDGEIHFSTANLVGE